jgi:hypothetical protein
MAKKARYANRPPNRPQKSGFIRLKTKPLFGGQEVMIEQGPFAGLMGKVEQEWHDGKRVAILLEAIGKARVLIDKRRLAVAAEI